MDAIYDTVFSAAPERVQKNQHWREKVRQVLQLNKEFCSTERGTWQLS